LERKARFFCPEGFATQILAGKKMRPNSSHKKNPTPHSAFIFLYSLFYFTSRFFENFSAKTGPVL
jgi:hypothetical protein